MPIWGERLILASLWNLDWESCITKSFMCFIDVKSVSCLDQEDLYQQAPNTANIKRPIHLHCYLKSTGYVTSTLLFLGRMLERPVSWRRIQQAWNVSSSTESKWHPPNGTLIIIGFSFFSQVFWFIDYNCICLIAIFFIKPMLKKSQFANWKFAMVFGKMHELH